MGIPIELFDVYAYCGACILWQFPHIFCIFLLFDVCLIAAGALWQHLCARWHLGRALDVCVYLVAKARLGQTNLVYFDGLLNTVPQRIFHREQSSE